MHILIVESTQNSIKYIEDGLAKNYHHVDILHDAELALIRCIQKYYDIIIVSKHLSGMSGTSFIKAVRDSDIHSQIIYICSDATTDDEINGTKSGANAFISAPFTFFHLLEKVNNLSIKLEYPMIYTSTEIDSKEESASYK